MNENIKTLVIYNDIESNLKYFIVEEDFSRFNGMQFNLTQPSPLEMECNLWLYNDEGFLNHPTSEDVSIVEQKQWDKIAVITWNP